MNKEKTFERKIGKTVFIVEVKNVEKSTKTAIDLIRKAIKREVMNSDF